MGILQERTVEEGRTNERRTNERTTNERTNKRRWRFEPSQASETVDGASDSKMEFERSCKGRYEKEEERVGFEDGDQSFIREREGDRMLVWEM